MSRPLPIAPDHERHDPLLVAQHAAGDRLEPEQQGQVEWWVAGCGACAALVADLRTVSIAVAREPAPPRRRDFRLRDEDLHRLRGGPLSRLMRRLALPQSSVLRPAAAGVLSIGLLLVVAGTAWPGGDVVLPAVEPEAAQLVQKAPPAAGTEAAPLEQTAPSEVAERSERMAEELAAAATGAAAPAASDPGDGAATARSKASAAAAMAADELGDPGFPEEQDAAAGLDTPVGHQAPDEAPEAILSDDVVQAGDGYRPEPADALEAADALDEASADTASSRLAAPDAEAVGRVAPESASAAVDELRQTDRDTAAATAAGNGLAAADEVASGAAGDARAGLQPERVLTALGLALTVFGAGLLGLLWLARRRVDPLLR